MGRPVLFDQRAKASVLGLVTAGVSQRTAAAFLGIDASTISKAAKSDPQFSRDLLQAKATAKVHPQLTRDVEAERNLKLARYWQERAKRRDFATLQPSEAGPH